MPKQLAADQASTWQARIAEQQRSGEPMAQFCRRHGLCVKTFYRWRARLCAQPAPVSALQFVQVKMPAARTVALMTVRLACGARLFVLDASVVPALIAALR